MIRTEIAISYSSHESSQKSPVFAHHQQREEERNFHSDYSDFCRLGLPLFWTFPIDSSHIRKQ